MVTMILTRVEKTFLCTCKCYAPKDYGAEDVEECLNPNDTCKMRDKCEEIECQCICGRVDEI